MSLKRKFPEGEMPPAKAAKTEIASTTVQQSEIQEAQSATEASEQKAEDTYAETSAKKNPDEANAASDIKSNENPAEKAEITTKLDPKESKSVIENKKAILHTEQNVRGNRFYVGETCLAKFPEDEFHYEATIKEVHQDKKSVEIAWFNLNPKYTKIEIDLLEKADTETIYVGEKVIFEIMCDISYSELNMIEVWARFTDGQLYEAKVEKINLDDAGEVENYFVQWFNDNPEHRLIKKANIEKLSDLDFQERFEDPEVRENDEKQEAAALKNDLDMDLKTLLEKEYGIKM